MGDLIPKNGLFGKSGSKKTAIKPTKESGVKSGMPKIQSLMKSRQNSLNGISNNGAYNG